jgi:hypothetical protein
VLIFVFAGISFILPIIFTHLLGCTEVHWREFSVNIRLQDNIKIISFTEPRGTVFKFGSLLIRGLTIRGKGELREILEPFL